MEVTQLFVIQLVLQLGDTNMCRPIICFIPSRDTCVPKQDTSQLLRPSAGTLSRWYHVLCSACKRTQCTYLKKEGVRPGVPGPIGSKLHYMVLSEVGLLVQT